MGTQAHSAGAQYESSKSHDVSTVEVDKKMIGRLKFAGTWDAERHHELDNARAGGGGQAAGNRARPHLRLLPPTRIRGTPAGADAPPPLHEIRECYAAWQALPVPWMALILHSPPG